MTTRAFRGIFRIVLVSLLFPTEIFSSQSGASSHFYEIRRYLDQGRYSNVFEAVHTGSNSSVILKIMKNRAAEKQKKEVDVLRSLKGLPGIVDLMDIVDSDFMHTTLIYRRFGSEVQPLSQRLNDPLSEAEVRHFFRLLLTSLRLCHERQIMHRDLKPRNVLIDRNSKALCIIDFGLSDYVRPGKSYSPNVGSRNFKAPELLLGDHFYDCAVDIWSAGCIFAGLLFGDEPFFSGKNDVESLLSIASVLGFQDIQRFAETKNIKFRPGVLKSMKHRTKIPLSEFKIPKLTTYSSKHALDLLSKMLVVDPKLRYSVNACLDHKYFLGVDSAS